MSELHPEGILRQMRIYHSIRYTRHLIHPQFTDPETYCETSSYTDTRMEEVEIKNSIDGKIKPPFRTLCFRKYAHGLGTEVMTQGKYTRRREKLDIVA